MKVLVTGGAGFLGSHVCEYYAKNGHEVVAYDNLSKFELERSGFDHEAARLIVLKMFKDNKIKFVADDIRNLSALKREAQGCDYIVHCAAQPAMTIAIETPELDASVNIMGTLNVLEMARQNNCPVLNCSTIHIYGNGINDDLVETDNGFKIFDTAFPESIEILIGELSPLHASKRSAEIYCQVYRDMYGVRAGTFRLTGMYGTRQYGGEDHGWVANFAIRKLRNQPITVFGTEKQMRDIIWVNDAVSAIDAWYRNGKADIYNIGGGTDTLVSLGEVIRRLGRLTKNDTSYDLQPARQGDLWYFCCDSSKAYSEFGWKPVHKNLDENLAKMLAFFSEHQEIFK